VIVESTFDGGGGGTPQVPEVEVLDFSFCLVPVFPEENIFQFLNLKFEFQKSMS
jgi:hypothetical protein